ncbi:MAG: hypothetical protein ABJA98_11965 [Acidobacteriota bacterium]
MGLTAALGVSARATEPPADIKATLRGHGAQSMAIAGADEAPDLYAFIDLMKARLKELFPTLSPLPAIDLIFIDRLNDVSTFAGACDQTGNACALVMTEAASKLPPEKQRAGLAHEISHIIIEREGVEKLLNSLPPQVVAALVNDLSKHIHAIRDYINRQTPFADERKEMYNYIAGAQTEEILSDAIGKLILCDGEIFKSMIDSPVDLKRQIADATRRYMEEQNLPDSGKERFKRRFDILNVVMHHPGGRDRKRFIDLIDLQSAPGCQAGPGR